MKVIKYIFLYGQVFFSILLLIWAIAMVVRCIVEGCHAFYIVCFVAMTASTWFLMVKPSWAELKEEKGGRHA